MALNFYPSQNIAATKNLRFVIVVPINHSMSCLFPIFEIRQGYRNLNTFFVCPQNYNTNNQLRRSSNGYRMSMFLHYY